jgi:TRAP-type C4-dicarboxylate transport system substrate-binding protein
MRVAKNITLPASTRLRRPFDERQDWEGLHADEQAVITAAADFRAEIRRDRQRSVDAVPANDQGRGCNVYTLTADEQKAFTDLSLKVMDEVKAEVKGPGLELIDILDGLRGQ